MPPPTPPVPDPVPVRVPHAQATTLQIALALTYTMRALHRHFPTLDIVGWTNILLPLQFDLWVAGEEVYLDYDDLCYLTQRLAAASPLPELDPPIYLGPTRYLAERVLNWQDEALQALPELAANPRAYGDRVFTLVTSLAMGNAVASEVYRATHRQRDPPPHSQARATAAEQVYQLHHARGEFDFTERPASPTHSAEPAAPDQ